MTKNRYSKNQIALHCHLYNHTRHLFTNFILMIIICHLQFYTFARLRIREHRIYFKLTNNNLSWSNVFKTMYGQTLLMFKSFVAIIAQESLLLMVGYFVTLQFTSCKKTVRALVTFVWLFSSVCSPHMDCHMASCDAWKVTLWTFVRLFSRVGHLVQPHMCQLNWRISTLVALMRLYPSVRHNVFS